MKKILFALIVSVFALTQNVKAFGASTPPAVEMVSYEQSWSDSKGTIALKNNTTEDIHNVSFILEYLDMQGKPMDYETFSYNIDIAPGMTKKLDIPAYEHSRYYHYYKTKDGIGNPAFKLRYELKDFNQTAPVKSSDTDISGDLNNNRYDGISSIILIILILAILGVYVGMYVLVPVMAQRRNRNPVIWLLLSFIGTPFLMCLILLAIGKSRNREC